MCSCAPINVFLSVFSRYGIVLVWHPILAAWVSQQHIFWYGWEQEKAGTGEIMKWDFLSFVFKGLALPSLTSSQCVNPCLVHSILLSSSFPQKPALSFPVKCSPLRHVSSRVVVHILFVFFMFMPVKSSSLCLKCKHCFVTFWIINYHASGYT